MSDDIEDLVTTRPHKCPRCGSRDIIGIKIDTPKFAYYCNDRGCGAAMPILADHLAAQSAAVDSEREAIAKIIDKEAAQYGRNW